MITTENLEQIREKGLLSALACARLSLDSIQKLSQLQASALSAAIDCISENVSTVTAGFQSPAQTMALRDKVVGEHTQNLVGLGKGVQEVAMEAQRNIASEWEKNLEFVKDSWGQLAEKAGFSNPSSFAAPSLTSTVSSAQTVVENMTNFWCNVASNFVKPPVAASVTPAASSAGATAGSASVKKK